MDHKRTIESRVTEVSPFLASVAELDRHLAVARKLRARATADMLAAAGRAVTRPVRAVSARNAHWWSRYAAIWGSAQARIATPGDDVSDAGAGQPAGPAPAAELRS